MPVGGDIWFQLTILLAIAVASHFILTRFGQPIIIVEIVIGIIIGPSLIGLLTNSDLITVFAQLGAIFLLFAIGLECNLNEIYTRKSLIIATGGVVVPWVVGFAFGLSVGQNFGTSVFIGAILVATSVAVTAEILVELGQLDKTIGKTIIGAAVVDDVLGMVVLTLSIGLSKDTISLSNISSVLPILTTVFGASLFIIVGGYIGSRYLGRIIMFIEAQTTKVKYSGFLFALMIMFFYAFISERIGMSAIIGAFVAGTMFSTVAIKKEIDDGAMFLSTIFTPIFFISIGIMVDFRGIAGMSVLLFGILLTLIAILTKVIGCAIPAKAMGMTTKEAFIVGYGMSPRCEVALIIALLGLSSGIITQNIYFMAVVVAILTTLVTPPLLKMMFKEQRKTMKKKEPIDIFTASKKNN